MSVYNNIIRVVKVYKEPIDEVNINIYIKEVEKLKKHQDENIVKAYDTGTIEYKEEKYFYVILDYIDGKALDEIKPNVFKETLYSERINLLDQILNTIDVFRAKYELHNDLHLGNLILSNDKKVKIIDFGSSKISYDPLDSDYDLYSIKHDLINFFLTKDEIDRILKNIDLKSVDFKSLKQIISDEKSRKTEKYKIVRDKIKIFRDSRISMIYKNKLPVPFYPSPKIVLHLIPFTSFKSDHNYDLDKPSLYDIEPMGSLGFDHGYNIDGKFTYSSFKQRQESYSYVQLFKNGIIEAVNSKILWSRKEEKIIPIILIEKELIKKVPVYIGVYEKLNIEAPIFLSLSLVDVKGFKTPKNRDYWSKDLFPIDRDIILIPEIIIEDLEFDPSELLRPIFDLIWNACGYPWSLSYIKDGVYKKQIKTQRNDDKNQKKWQEFYSRIANTDPKHLGIDIQYLLNNKIYESDFEKVLKMNVGANDKYFKIYSNQYWFFSFINNRMGGDRYEIFVKNEKSQLSYDFFKSDVNEIILKQWLDYIIEYCAIAGMKIER